MRKRMRLVEAGAVNGSDETQRLRDFDSHVETGFQIATFQGPLCAEPMEGMAFFLEALDVDEARVEQESCRPRL